MPLMSGNIRPQSCQLVETLWTDPGLKNEISVRELLSLSPHTHTHTHKPANNNNKKALAGNEWSNILLKFSQARKKSPVNAHSKQADMQHCTETAATDNAWSVCRHAPNGHSLGYGQRVSADGR